MHSGYILQSIIENKITTLRHKLNTDEKWPSMHCTCDKYTETTTDFINSGQLNKDF